MSQGLTFAGSFAKTAHRFLPMHGGLLGGYGSGIWHVLTESLAMPQHSWKLRPKSYPGGGLTDPKFTYLS